MVPQFCQRLADKHSLFKIFLNHTVHVQTGATNTSSQKTSDTNQSVVWRPLHLDLFFCKIVAVKFTTSTICIFCIFVYFTSCIYVKFTYFVNKIAARLALMDEKWRRPLLMFQKHVRIYWPFRERNAKEDFQNKTAGFCAFLKFEPKLIYVIQSNSFSISFLI